MGPTTTRIFVLGALLLGCPTEEPAGPEEGSSSGSGSSSSSETTSFATSSSGTTRDGTGDTTHADGTTTTSSSSSTTATDEGSTSASDTSGSGTSDTSGTTSEPMSACQQGCAVEASCTMDWPSEDECASACEANLVRAAVFAQTCADAWEALSECLGTLTCEEFLEWRMPTTFPYPCVEADEGLQFECKGQ